MTASPASDLAGAVAATGVLPAAWTHVPPPPNVGMAALAANDGRRVLVTVGAGRAVFAAQPPPGRCEWTPLAISVRADRDPADIARELMRRLLPRYGPAYQDAVAEAHTNEVETAREQAALQATADQLYALTPPHPYPSRIRVERGRATVSWSSGTDGPYGVGDAQINHDGTVVTELRIRWLPAAAAARVLAALTQGTP